MKQRIHTLKSGIQTLESMLAILNGTMLKQATEELKNMRFELDMLTRDIQKPNNLQVQVHELAGHEA